MHKHGGDIYSNKNVIDFSANINPLGMPDFIKQAAKDAIDECSAYPDCTQRDLVKAIAEREDVGEEQIICTNGAAELIFGLCFALKPKNALVLCPSFEEYRQALEAVDCNVREHFLTKEKDFILNDDYLDDLSNDLDMVFICNPNNPTGQMIDDGLLNRIMEKCKANSIFLVIDECFLDFLNNDDLHTKKNKGPFVIKAFTKMYAMAGLRLGYGIYHDVEILNKIKRVLQPWNVSTVAQKAGVLAAKDVEFQKSSREMIDEEKAFMLNNLCELVEKIYGYSSNYIFFQDEVDLYKELFHKGIMIRDCGNFKGLEKGFYRIAIKTHEDNLKLIKAMQEVKNG